MPSTATAGTARQPMPVSRMSHPRPTTRTWSGTNRLAKRQRECVRDRRPPADPIVPPPPTTWQVRVVLRRREMVRDYSLLNTQARREDLHRLDEARPARASRHLCPELRGVV